MGAATLTVFRRLNCCRGACGLDMTGGNHRAFALFMATVAAGTSPNRPAILGAGLVNSLTGSRKQCDKTQGIGTSKVSTAAKENAHEVSSIWPTVLHFGQVFFLRHHM